MISQSPGFGDAALVMRNEKHEYVNSDQAVAEAVRIEKEKAAASAFDFN